MDPYAFDGSAWKLRMYQQMAVASPLAQFKPVFVGCKPVAEIVAELRESHPKEAMMLGEYLVLSDED